MGHLLEIDSARMQVGGRGGCRTILQHAYLQVRSGEAVALLGLNGCGKSTLLQMLYGTRKGTFRHVRFDGQPVEKAFREPKHVRYLPQFHFIPGHLSVRRAFADYQVELSSFTADFPDLTRCAEARIEQLSGGERRLIEAYLIIRSPSAICLLDEPFSQLMPLHIATLKRLIRDQVRAREKGYVIADHLYRDALQICDRICLLKEGYVSEISASGKELAALGYMND
ncbi:MAG: ATP-binding cassette domain-containing protein [Rikenella sp.]|nr:ATP-binding cassette domain-containing protein [Rikenella sp.]